MNILRRFALWLVWDGPRLPFGLAPWLMGFGMGVKGKRVK